MQNFLCFTSGSWSIVSWHQNLGYTSRPSFLVYIVDWTLLCINCPTFKFTPKQWDPNIQSLYSRSYTWDHEHNSSAEVILCETVDGPFHFRVKMESFIVGKLRAVGTSWNQSIASSCGHFICSHSSLEFLQNPSYFLQWLSNLLNVTFSNSYPSLFKRLPRQSGHEQCMFLLPPWLLRN